MSSLTAKLSSVTLSSKLCAAEFAQFNWFCKSNPTAKQWIRMFYHNLFYFCIWQTIRARMDDWLSRSLKRIQSQFPLHHVASFVLVFEMSFIRFTFVLFQMVASSQCSQVFTSGIIFPKKPTSQSIIRPFMHCVHYISCRSTDLREFAFVC
jgi:hypothetical protein